MEVKSIFRGVFITVHDSFKHRGIMLSREVVKEILDSEEYLSDTLFKMIKKKASD